MSTSEEKLSNATDSSSEPVEAHRFLIPLETAHCKENSDQCSTLEELTETFAQKTSLVRTALQFKRLDPYITSSTFEELDKIVIPLQNVIEELKQEVEKRIENLRAVEELSIKLYLLETILDQEISDLPEVSENGGPDEENMKIPILTEQANHAEEEQPPLEQQQNGKKLKTPPEIALLTETEFKAVPSYMKGRLSFESMNNFIQGFNKTIVSKYQFMAKPRNQMGTVAFKKYQEMKKQENKETKGVFFCVSEDFKTYGHVKFDSNIKNMLSILRHCSRMKEIRGPGAIVRYAVLVKD